MLHVVLFDSFSRHILGYFLVGTICVYEWMLDTDTEYKVLLPCYIGIVSKHIQDQRVKVRRSYVYVMMSCTPWKNISQINQSQRCCPFLLLWRKFNKIFQGDAFDHKLLCHTVKPTRPTRTLNKIIGKARTFTRL